MEKYGFKKKISGYNPVEVDEYIENLEKEHSQKLKEFQQESEDFSKKVASLEEYIQKLEEEKVKNQKLIYDEESRKNARVDLSEFNLVKKQNKDLNQKLLMYTDKVKKYDEIINKVEAIVGEGREKAEGIIASAHENSKTIQDIAIRKVEQHKVQAKKVMDDISGEYKIMIEELKSYRDKFKDNFIAIDNNICKLGQRIDTITLKYLDQKEN